VSQKKRSTDSAIQSVQRAATILRSFTEADAELPLLMTLHRAKELTWLLYKFLHVSSKVAQ